MRPWSSAGAGRPGRQHRAGWGRGLDGVAIVGRVPRRRRQLHVSRWPAGCSRAARRPHTRVAQQLGLLANLPSVAVTTLLALNGIHPTLALAIGAAALLVLNRLCWRVTSAMFDRERLITGSR
jgi:hypothetical protein